MNKYLEIANKVKKEVEMEIGQPIKIRKYGKSPWSGRAWFKTYEIIVPEPKSDISLSTYLHELGHLRPEASSEKKSCMNEYRAEMFAEEMMKKHGIRRSKKMRKHANWYIAYSLAQALNRGMVKIPDELKKYKKMLRKTKWGWRA